MEPEFYLPSHWWTWSRTRPILFAVPTPIQDPRIRITNRSGTNGVEKSALKLRWTVSKLGEQSPLMRPILPVMGFISGLPAGIMRREPPPRRWHGQCTSAGPAVPIREAKRGGAPVLLKMPRSARPSRELDSNCNGHSRLEKSVRARRKAAFVHMPPFFPCALPDRHETPLFCGQYQAPANRFG